MKISRHIVGIVMLLVTAAFFPPFSNSAEIVKLGLNYPKTGPYSVQGLDQLRAATLAVEEINNSGGILGRKIELVVKDSQSRVDVTERNVRELIDSHNVSMVFGGSASSVAIATAKICRQKRILFFGTLTYSTATTGLEASRYTFRECYNSWMGAKTIASYLNNNFPSSKNKYFYITADYTWGHTTEAAVRKFTDTENNGSHKGILTSFPGATEKDFRKAIAFAKIINPDVLVLVLFGKDMSNAIRHATIQGLKTKMQIIVPNLTLGMAESGGPKVMEGVIGALPWCWKVPYQYNYQQGIEFVEKYAKRFARYPSSSGGSAYTILYQYRDAVERVGSFSTPEIIRSLEGYSYQMLKDIQIWRSFDHQSVQTVYAVKCKKAHDVMKDKFKLDYFEIIDSLRGSEAARTREEWNRIRKRAGKSVELESLGDVYAK